MPFTDPDQARQYLASISDHPGRAGDTANMHPDFAIRLANSLEQARGQGLNLRVMSGYRDPAETTNQGLRTRAALYDLRGQSSHSYGLASDINGLDGPNGAITQKWAQIAGANGLNNPYGIGNGKEFNHWQIGPKLETQPDLLNRLKAARATGNFQNVWNAFGSAGTQGTQTQVANPNDPRQLVYNMLTSKDIGLTPQQAVGAIWSLAGESGPGLNPRASNPNDPGTAFGLGQWTQERKANLLHFASANNLSPTDAATQVAFMKQELLGDHNNVLTAIRGASTSADANHVWTTMYEVPKYAEQRATERAAAGPKSASLDANGNLVLPAAGTAVASGQAPAAGGAQTPAAPTPPMPMMTPAEAMQMSLGQQLANLGSSGVSSGTSSSGIHDNPDAPPIRTPAMETPIPAPNPMPTNLGGALGGMATLQPLQDPSASITAGAPSMTSMLDTLGTPANFNMLDPRATQAPSLTMRSPRLA